MQLIVKYMIKSFNLFFKRTFLKKKQTNKLSQIFRFILFLLKEKIPKYETSVICAVFFYPLHTRWKLNVPMTFRRRPGRPIYVMSPGGKFRLYCACEMFSWHDFISSKFHVNVRYPEVVVRRYFLLKKHVLEQVFSCEFLRTPIFTEHLWVLLLKVPKCTNISLTVQTVLIGNLQKKPLTYHFSPIVEDWNEKVTRILVKLYSKRI